MSLRSIRRLFFRNPILTDGVFCFTESSEEDELKLMYLKPTGLPPFNFKFLISNCSYVGVPIAIGSRRLFLENPIHLFGWVFLFYIVNGELKFAYLPKTWQAGFFLTRTK